MKILIGSLTLVGLLNGCSSMPSYHEMSCGDLKKNEKSLQSKLRYATADSVISGIADIIDDTTESAVDSAIADNDLNATKSELRTVQSAITQKRCKK